MVIRKKSDVLSSRLALPWPHALLALWTAILLIGGPQAAKAGLSGPIYPTEVFFLVGLGALFFGATRKRLARIRDLKPPVWLTLALCLIALSFFVALVRGVYHGYGSEILADAGLGYLLLAPFITLAFIGREQWQDSVFKIFFWASVISVPLIFVSHFERTYFAPLSLSDGFVVLFSVALLLHRWLNGSLVWFGKLYIVTVSILTIAFVPSRSAILSFLVGLTTVIVLNLQTLRRRVIAGAVVLAVISIGSIFYLAKPSLFNQANPVRLARDTVTFSSNTKGNNARWRLDFTRTLLRRSLRSSSNALVGVGLGKPSRFVWRKSCCKAVFDYREDPMKIAHTNPPPAGPQVTGPHNGFSDLVYRIGWPAALAVTAFFLFLILAGREVFRRASRSDRQALSVLIALVMSGIVVALTSDSFRVPETAVPFAFVVGLLFARVLPLWRSNYAGKQSNKPGQLWHYKAVWLAPLLALAIGLTVMSPFMGLQGESQSRPRLTPQQSHKLAVSFRESFVSRMPSLEARAFFKQARCQPEAEHQYYLCSLAADDVNPLTGAHRVERRLKYKVYIASNGCWVARAHRLYSDRRPQKQHSTKACLTLRQS